MNELLDNVHGRIKYSDGEKTVIDSPAMQRLRRISQLTAVDVVFPGGTHNRFIHSLGVMKLCGDYMKAIIDNSNCILDNQDRWTRLARMAGLLHDIGHGPFSHAYDRVVYAQMYDKTMNSHWPDGGHDFHRIKIVSHPEMAARIEKSGVSVADLISVWNATPDSGMYFIIKTIVGGPLGADRMDFIMRDAYNTGKIHYGTIDATRIIANVSISKSFSETMVSEKYTLCYNAKIISDVRHALDGRHYMYDEVYFHQKSMAASYVIEKIMEMSCVPLRLVLETDDIDKFIDLDEHSLVERARHIPNAAPYVEMYKRRILPETVYSGIMTLGADWPEEYSDLYEYFLSNVDAPTGTEFVKTRPITGIDPKKFDYYNIKFLEKSGDMVSCADLLNRKNITPIEPYCIVRGFQFKN